jgi:hypothetical protein
MKTFNSELESVIFLNKALSEFVEGIRDDKVSKEDIISAISRLHKLHNSDVSGAKVNVPDIKVVGNGDMFRLLCKASSAKEGWMKSSKAMEIEGVGCFVQVTTQQRNPDGSYALAEAISFAPNTKIIDDENNGRKLIAA